MTFTITPEARRDLDDIWEYTARRWNVDQADEYISSFVETLNDLADNTIHGRKVDFLLLGYFKYPIGSHVAYYRFQSNVLDLVRVLHKRMDASRHIDS
ncbi:MAG: type II toxin-antitoxin system RelE/ParE family toxin [Thermomicrobiales bacterium]